MKRMETNVSQPSTVEHADPQANVLLGHHPAPAREGQPITLSDPKAALVAAEAILGREEGYCRFLGLLPDRYDASGECDREEFFEPHTAVALAEDDPRGGWLDEATGQPVPDLCAAIAATISEMHRSFDCERPISERLRLRLMAACRAELDRLAFELVREMNAGEAQA